MVPYLESPLRELFDAWLDAAVRRYAPPLEFAEIRRGVQALSSLYVERRAAGALAARATRGHGKRAALASYYAPLHFLCVHHALRALEPPRGVARVLDLGCGSGATGAALATSLESRPDVLGSDVSGWALGEAGHTYTAFGVAGSARRARLPGRLARVRPGDCIALGWVVNELEDAPRKELLERVGRALASGAALFLSEPLARGAAPWWDDWARALAPLGARASEIHAEVERPDWIESLDRASRLDHRTLGVRVLLVDGGGC